jgi:hypothetical protein
MSDKIVSSKTKIVKSKSFIGSAVDLLKEIRIISGINERKYYKSSDVQVSNEFNYINHMIDKFRYKFELKGFKK